jgi:diguanylate cyclase (GGDEF)-like protein
MPALNQTLSLNAQLLKSRVTMYAVYGVIISAMAIIIATILSSYFLFGEITLNGLIQAQKENFVLWFLDGMPFIFALWGQYVSTMMAYEAGALVIDQTQELRAQTVALENKSMHNATHDALTGLPNRTLFHDRVSQAINSAKRENKHIAILLLDLDRFKEINDTMGHYNGDRILTQVTMRLSGVTRDSDTLARLGGDEFAILLSPVTDVKDVETMAKKIEKAFLPPFAVEGLTLDVQASIGAVRYPEHGTDVDTLIQRSDVAMYVAKHQSKGFVVYSPKLDQYSPHRLTLMSELRQAIADDELLLNYQPQLKSSSGKVAGVEALVRWQHKTHGLIPPDDFISLAERTGLIKQLTRWVLRSALQQAIIWHQGGMEIDIAVNLSARNLLDPEFPDVIAGLLASYEFPTQHLILEITETALMADPDLAGEILSRIAEMGVRFSIDDFGTGYSSLAYLKRLPVSEIKIDRSFVMEMMTDENDAVIVHATIELGHNLGLKVVAEGIESEEAMQKLKTLGCDFLQGYHISKPMAAKDFVSWVKARP